MSSLTEIEDALDAVSAKDAVKELTLPLMNTELPEYGSILST